jgi:hypothetical protein
MSSDEVVRIEGTAPSWEGSLEAWADYARKLKEVEEAPPLPPPPRSERSGEGVTVCAACRAPWDTELGCTKYTKHEDSEHIID